MHTHPDIGRLLAQAKIEEAQPRLAAVPALRADSLERVERPAAERATGRRFIPEPSTAAITRRWLGRQPSARTSGTRTNG